MPITLSLDNVVSRHHALVMRTTSSYPPAAAASYTSTVLYCDRALAAAARTAELLTKFETLIGDRRTNRGGK